MCVIQLLGVVVGLSFGFFAHWSFKHKYYGAMVLFLGLGVILSAFLLRQNYLCSVV